MFPKEKTIAGIEKLNHTDLYNHLQGAGICFNREASLTELQAIWAMNKLGIVCEGDTPDPSLLEYVTMRCSMSDTDLVEALSERGYHDGSDKWQRVEILIRDDYQIFLDVEDDDDIDGSVRQHMKERHEYPDPIVMNLVISTIHGEIPNFPIISKELEILINRLPQFKTASDVTWIFSADGVAKLAANFPSKEKVGNLLSLILSQASALELEHATGEMRILGLHQGVQQLIVSRQKRELLERFNVRLAAASGQSILVFHGTPLVNVPSILQNGFRTDPDCWMWTVEEPSTTINYAYKGMGHQSRWLNTPYKGCGVILGCELAGTASKIGQEGVGSHKVTDTDSLLVRYVFVLPPLTAPGGGWSAIPERAQIKPGMIAAFEKMRTRE